MSKVLYIKANIKQEGESRTFKVSDSFVEEYKKNMFALLGKKGYEELREVLVKRIND